MTDPDPRIVGELGHKGIDMPIKTLPPGYIALLSDHQSVYRWEIIRALDVVRVSQGSAQGRCPRRAGNLYDCWPEVHVHVLHSPAYPVSTVIVVSTATLQAVLDALTAALRPAERG